MALSGIRFAALGAVMLVPLLGITKAPAGAPPCVRATVEMTSDVDTARALALDPFEFRLAEAAVAPDGTAVPAGTPGFGVVAISNHAQRGGRGGYVVLETRYLRLADGKTVAVTIDWTSAERATATGSSQNIPGFVGAVPFVGYVLGPYGFLHHGKDITIAHGTRIPVVVGDDIAAGACRVPPPSPSSPVLPAPSASPVSSASPAVSPAPSPRV